MAESLTAKVMRTPVPVNRAAASIIRPGIRYEENFISLGEILSEAPLPTIPYPRSARPEDDISGLKFGRFTVIGMADLPSRSSKASWVVRCACGRFCYRKKASLMGCAGSTAAMCRRCDHVESKKRGERSDPAEKQLRRAAPQMYRALHEILRVGLTTTTRNLAIDALNLAEGKQ